MISHPPFAYQRNSLDDDRELHGIFRVMHDKGLQVDCTYNRPELQTLNACSERPLQWLWQDKIPLGKLTLIEGPPAVGKLFVALDIAARVSNGVLGGGAPLGDTLPSSQGGATPAGPQLAPDAMPESCRRDHNVARPPLPPLTKGGSEATAAGGATAGPQPAPDATLESLMRDHFVTPPTPPPLPEGGNDEAAAAQSSADDGGAPVVVVCDSWQAEDMIGPRLRMLGANSERVVMFTEVDCTDSFGGHRHPRPIRMALDHPMFDFILRKHRGCRLIVIDDLEHYCESPKELRRVIRELDQMAIYFNVAIVATLQGNVRFAPDGAIRDAARASDGQARCIWCVTPDPTHPGLLRLEPKRMAFCKKPEGIAFRISDAGKIAWEPLPLYEKPPTEAARRKKREHERMLKWLRDTLGTDVVLAETIYDAGREQGFSQNKLIAARQEIAARTFKYGFGRTGAWMWTLKPAAEVTDGEVQAAYLYLTDDPLQNQENFGVLSEKRGKNGDSRKPGTGRKPSSAYDGLTTAQLREVALQKLGLLRPKEPAEQDAAGRPVGNGQAGNGKSGNGHDRNGRLG